MPTTQELLRIAMRYRTAMSDAMIVACVQRHHETGEPLDFAVLAMGREIATTPEPPAPTEDEWRRYVERNSDTRLNHC